MDTVAVLGEIDGRGCRIWWLWILDGGGVGVGVLHVLDCDDGFSEAFLSGYFVVPFWTGFGGGGSV